MICPKCGFDYKDVEPGRVPGGVVRVDDHFYKNSRRLGRHCTRCGFVAEFIEKPTGEPFHKRSAAEQMEESRDRFRPRHRRRSRG